MVLLPPMVLARVLGPNWSVFDRLTISAPIALLAFLVCPVICGVLGCYFFDKLQTSS
jgi:hypothetical protein